MDLRLIDMGSIIELRDCIVELTNLDFSVYDKRGRLLASSVSEDPLPLIGRDNHTNFVKSCISKAILRKGVSVFKGIMGQHHCLIPVQIGDAVIVFVGNSFYTSANDFETFCVAKGADYGLSAEDMKSLARKVLFRDLGDVLDVCRNCYRLYTLFLKGSYEKNRDRERYRKIRTLMELFSDIDQDTITEEGVFDLLCDGIIFLFSGDTVSLLIGAGDTFTPFLTRGRVKEMVEPFALKNDSFIVSEIIKNRKPVLCLETMEILRLGYPEEITSLHVFPLMRKDGIIGLLSIFNSRVSDEDSASISNLCRFSEFLLEHVDHRKSCARYTKDLEVIEFSSTHLSAVSEPEALYKSIVEISSQCLNAEKASLMMPDEETGELSIKATKGMNKWIAKGVRVRDGEGIAGKVFREGTPLIIADLEKDPSSRKRPHYRTNSFVSVPIKSGGETIGVLNFADKRTGEAFSEADRQFLRYFIPYAAMAIKGSQYYRISEQMRTLSITDSLTGLFNRRYLDNRLFEEIQRATRYERVFALALFDIDDFKLFNDAEGHSAGDEALKTIANIARESIRSIDILGRFGGEEFSIIMPQTDKNAAFLVAERVRKNIREFMPATWKRFPRERLTVSIGISTFPAEGKDAKALIRSADKALYRGKISGKDRTMVNGSSDSVVRNLQSEDSWKI